MEGSFRREGTPQAPGHEPPVDPGGGPSYGGLSLVARILRGRELAAEAAGIPPLDSDQVLDLQRTAGNQLTTGALARWIDGLQAAETAAALEPFARPGHAAQHPPEVLLGLLTPAATHHPAAHAQIAAAITAMEPVIEVRLSCVGGEQLAAEIVLAGAEPAVTDLFQDDAFTLELPCAAVFGPLADYRGNGTIPFSAAGSSAQLAIGAPEVIQAGNARLVAIATVR
jgi:hypothetical protein